MNKAALFDVVLSLGPIEEGELIDKLIASYDDGEYAQVSPNVLAEVESRLADIDEGRIKLVPAAEVFQRFKI